MNNIFLIICFILITMTGCNSDNVEEQSLRSVRLLSGNLALGNSVTYIEIIEPNVLRFITNGSPRNQNEQDFVYFDSALLSDFVSMAPNIEMVIPLELQGISPLTREWTIELSQEEERIIQRLIQNVVRGSVDSEFQLVSFRTGHHPYIWAIIDDNMYWSYYTANINSLPRRVRREYINRDLLYLVYEIIDLSPYPVPLRSTPRSQGY